MRNKCSGTVIPCKQLMRSNHAMVLEFLHRLLPQSLPGSTLGLSAAFPVDILRSLSTWVDSLPWHFRKKVSTRMDMVHMNARQNQNSLYLDSQMIARVQLLVFFAIPCSTSSVTIAVKLAYLEESLSCRSCNLYRRGEQRSIIGHWSEQMKWINDSCRAAWE